jgi:hypothetical protein
MSEFTQIIRMLTRTVPDVRASKPPWQAKREERDEKQANSHVE